MPYQIDLEIGKNPEKNPTIDKFIEFTEWKF